MGDIGRIDDSAAAGWRGEWMLREGVSYLNHGSFGPSPRKVQEARNEWQRRLESEPVDFFVRQMERHLQAAAARVGDFVGSPAEDLIFVDNATAAMNIVAASVPLSPGDEVLLTDHEYGAVRRLWQRTCDHSGARLVVQRLPSPLDSDDELVETLFAAVTPRTRLLVYSHITSPTAVILPAEKICRRARSLGLPVCIDGPHALGIVPLDLRRLDCDYYTASCHKWLCAPFGSGFLYVHRRNQGRVQPAVVSWGGSVSGRPASWRDEFTWIGTRDPSSYLAVPAALDFFGTAGWEMFRERTHQLARYARDRVVELTGLAPLVPDGATWSGSMISLPLPTHDRQPPAGGQRDPLQDALWERFRIEVPIFWWQGRRLVRVSCHLYTLAAEIDRLVEALRTLLREERPG